MAKSTSTFTSLKDLIHTHVEKIQPKEFQQISSLTKKWPELLGASIAQNARVQYLRNNVLHVKVTNSTWACELNLLKDELQEKINRGHTGDTPIQDIKFTCKPDQRF